MNLTLLAQALQRAGLRSSALLHRFTHSSVTVLYHAGAIPMVPL